LSKLLRRVAARFYGGRFVPTALPWAVLRRAVGAFGEIDEIIARIWSF